MLVGDDEKIVRWHRQGSTGLGTVDTRLPNAADLDDPAALLRERTPISGKFADRSNGQALFQELCRMVNAPEAGLEPD